MRLIDADELNKFPIRIDHYDKENGNEPFDKLKPGVDPADDDFGAVLNCAVRYAIGRRTYMPSLVIGFITPLLTQLSDTTLWCFDQDIEEARYTTGYGDPKADEPMWERFHEAVKAERVKRGEEARGE